MEPSSALADPTATGPKRLIIFFTPNGVGSRAPWLPSGSGTSFSLSTILAPLEAHKQELIILQGVDISVADIDPDPDGHRPPFGALLTGVVNNGNNTCGGPSIDQVLAKQFGTATKFPSILLGAIPGDEYFHMFSSGNGQPVPPERNPYDAF